MIEWAERVRLKRVCVKVLGWVFGLGFWVGFFWVGFWVGLGWFGLGLGWGVRVVLHRFWAVAHTPLPDTPFEADLLSSPPPLCP